MTANSRLIFPEDPTDQSGFASADADRALRGYAEPVVRELLQNCLDARENGQRVDVSISISRVPISQIPDLSGYRRAFDDVVRNRKEGGRFSETDNTVANRIEDVLGAKDGKMWVLVCRDDGQGLTDDTMSRLLSEGNTTKTDHGAGSVGLGHLTAFGASDLRYVIYGSRGPEGPIVSGRCLLAAHQPRGENETRSHKGTLALGKNPNKIGMFDSPFQYASQPPPLVKPDIDRITETGTAKTGTVVAILGFNHFGESAKSDEALRFITRTAAAHFAPAICDGRMAVKVKDEKKSITLDSPHSVGKALSKDGNIVRSERWRFPEGMAHRAWRTLNQGEKLSSETATILFRKLDDADWGRTRVNFFREGMWITNNHYHTGPFADRERFDAVVLADPENGRRFSELVRRSEGAEHYDINLRNLPEKERKELKGMLDEILDILLTKAESITKDIWRPTGFAAFGEGKERRRPRPLPPRPPVWTPGDGEGETPILEPGTTEPEPGPEPGPGPVPRPIIPTEEDTTARPGKSVSIPFAFGELVLGDNRDDKIRAIQVELGQHQEGVLGVRVIRATGGDETCDSSPRPEFCRISPGSPNLKEMGPFEVLVPTELRRFQIEMTVPVERGRGPLALDIVKRRP